MTRRIGGWALAVGVATAAAATTWMVAMRVELRAVETVGERTRMQLEVVIAPEDRGRIGANGWLEAAIRSGDRVVGRAQGPVTVAADGTAQIDAVWPPGPYELRVRLEGVQSGEVGVWQGAVEVPEMASAPATPTPPRPAPAETAALPARTPSPGPAAGQPSTATSPSRAGAPEAPPPVTPVPAASPESAVEPRGSWALRAAGRRDVTLMVLEASRPVPGLGADDLRVRVDGEPVKALLGDRSVAPLHLVIAVDLSASMSDELPALRRVLSGLAVRAQPPAGQTTVLTAKEDVSVAAEWGAAPEQVAAALGATGQAAAGDLAGLVVRALDALGDRRGRRFVVLVTDGGATSDRDGWRQAERAARAAGAPILQVRLRSDDGDRGVERRLTDLSEMTGGESYVAGNTDVLELAVEQFATLILGSYAVAVPVPSGDEPARVKVGTEAGGLDVHVPRFVGPAR